MSKRIFDMAPPRSEVRRLRCLITMPDGSYRRVVGTPEQIVALQSEEDKIDDPYPSWLAFRIPDIEAIDIPSGVF